MYFSSDVFYGLGGMDVYKANIQEDQSFGIPVNLGNAINSKKDDFGFIIRPNTQGQGLMGYFSSNRLGGAGSDDIYGFRVEGTLGLRTLVFKGKVANKRSNFAIADATVKILDANRNVLKEVVTQADGTYRIEIPWRAQVSLIASKPKHSIFYKTFDEATSDSSNFGNLDIQISMVSDIIEEKENKNVLKLENFKFEPKKSTLTTALTANLDTAISLIQQFPCNANLFTTARGF